MSILSMLRQRVRDAMRRDADESTGTHNMFYTAQAVPLSYLSITKCGSTFIKHLLHNLDHGADHPSGLHIHEGNHELERVPRERLDAVRTSPYCFTVLRDPVSRFTSLYFDKIIGTGPTSFPHVREHLLTRGVIEDGAADDVVVHQANARRFMGWLEENLDGRTELGMNSHWRKQSVRLNRARDFPLQHLTLDGLDWQMPLFTQVIVPDMAARMAQVGERNVTPLTIKAADILDDALIGHIRTVYGQDWVTYEKAQARWLPFAPINRPPPFAAVPLIGHHRVVVPHDQPRSVTGAFLSGVERVAGQIADRSLGDLGGDPVVLMRDPMDRFLAALRTIGADEHNTHLRYRRMLRRMARAGQWVAQPRTQDEIRGAITSYAAILNRCPGALRRHGMRPQYDEVQQAIEAGFRPVTSSDPVAAAGLSAERPPDPSLPDWRAALTPDLADQVRSLYRADFELYERLHSQTG